MAADSERSSDDRVLERWGWASIGLNLVLTAINLLVAWASASLAVAAEMVHNIVDLIASVSVLAGLKLARRKSRNFHYGLYKVENLVAAGISILIFLAAYEIGKRALLSGGTLPTVTPWVLAGVVASMLLPLGFSLLELRAGRAANSPSLIADASEFRVHVFTSGVVLAALVGHRIGFHLDRVAAGLVVIFVAKTGWDLLSNAMRVLLDASLDRETLDRVRAIIRREPSLVSIRRLQGRNAGRYRFLEAEIEVRLHELEQASLVARRVERAVQEEIHHVERVRIEVLPSRRDTVRIAMPLEGEQGPLSRHFGTAPHFLLIDRNKNDGRETGRRVLANPHAQGPRGRGLQVADWLLEHKVDILLTPDDIRDKGPGHALGEAGVEVIVTGAGSPDRILADSLPPPRGDWFPNTNNRDRSGLKT